MALLRDFAKLIRTKNAGPFLLTVDIMFPDAETYRHVANSGVLSVELMARTFKVPAEVVKLFHYDPANAIKVTIPRPVTSGSPEDTDLFGGQQFAPLVDVVVPDMPATLSNHSGAEKMSKPILRERVTDATAWKGPDLQNDTSWIYHLDAADIEDLEYACEHVKREELRWGEFTKEQFPLPRLSAKLADIDKQIRHGRGFVVIRGLPLNKYDNEQTRTLYWGLGAHLGQIISHNVKGDTMAPVTDLALKNDDPNRRNNTTNQILDPHTDLADVVMLLCIEKAKEGGISSLSSSVAIHNEILKNHPEYLEVLYDGFYHDYRGYGPSGDPNEVTETRIPVFEYNNGRVNCAFAKKIIETGAQKHGVPLTALQQAAIDYVHELAIREDMRIDMQLEPGDIQIINNYMTLHARTNYIDYDDGRKRYLLRMWVNLPDSMQLSPDFAKFVRRGIPAQEKTTETLAGAAV